MKKYILILLLTVAGYGQTLQNPTFGTVTTKTNTESATATKINVQETDGKINWLQPINIPIPIVPTNYMPTATTLGGHLIGIDNKLGTVVATTAGITTRVWFTADVSVVSATNYYATNATSKGTLASAIQNVVNNDNVKTYFAQDLIGASFVTATLFPPGVYAGNLSASTSPNSAQQRWTVELYKCDNSGTPIASGVTGAPVGSLGVTVITILDSGLLTLADGSVTNVQVSGNLGGTGLSIAVGERVRYHVSAEKVGTAGANITQSVYYGTSYNSYIDVPVPLNTTAVQNLSSVVGATTTDALNTLNTGKANDSNVIHKTGDETADGNKTFIQTVTSNSGLKVDLPVLGSSFISPNFATDLQQGYAWDGTNHYLIGTSKISKRDASYVSIVDNNTALTGITGVNHLGDGVYLGGFLYIPAETYPAVTGMQIAKYDATTLALVTTYDISAQGHECSAITTDGTTLYITSFLDGSKIWKYSLTGTYLGFITIAKPFTNGIQGIAYYGGEFYISEQTKISKLSLNGATQTLLGYAPGPIANLHRSEGLEVVSGVIRLSIMDTSNSNIYYLTNLTTNSNIFNVDANSGLTSISTDFTRKFTATNTDYTSLGNGDFMIGSRGLGTVPFIATRTNQTTSTGFFNLAIQSADAIRTGEADMVFRTGAETGGNTISTLTTTGTAFLFSNGTSNLTTISRQGSVSIGGLETTGNRLNVTGTTNALTGFARGALVNTTLVASANSDQMISLDIAPTFTNGAFTSTDNIALRVTGAFNQSHSIFNRNTLAVGQSTFTANDDTGGRFMDVGVANSSIASGASWGLAGEAFIRGSGGATGLHLSASASTAPVRFSTNGGVEKMRIYGASGNIAIQNGGTFTDNGVDRVQVKGTISGDTDATLSNQFVRFGQIIPLITITTVVSITTATTDAGGLGQNGRHVVISNGASAINLTCNGGVTTSYGKVGSGAITFVQGSGRTLVQLSGTAILNGIAGSRAILWSSGTTDYLEIINY